MTIDSPSIAFDLLDEWPVSLSAEHAHPSSVWGFPDCIYKISPTLDPVHERFIAYHEDAVVIMIISPSDKSMLRQPSEVNLEA
jgi:hypothetical protein